MPTRSPTDPRLAFRPACAVAALLLASLAGPQARAADFFVGADAAWLAIPVASADFGSMAIKLRAGASLPSGWGVELQTMAGLGDDDVGGLTLQADNVTAAFVRYETNPGADFRFFALAGYATTSLSFSGTGTEGLDDRYDGFAFGFGAMERLKWLPNTMAVLEANSYFNDSNVDVWSVSFGLRYDF